MKQVVVLQLLWTTFAVNPFKIACPFPNPLPPSQKKKNNKNNLSLSSTFHYFYILGWHHENTVQLLPRAVSKTAKFMNLSLLGFLQVCTSITLESVLVKFAVIHIKWKYNSKSAFDQRAIYLDKINEFQASEPTLAA